MYIDNKKELRQCTIHVVSGSFGSILDWVDNPESKKTDLYKVVAIAEVNLPHTVGNASIKIRGQKIHRSGATCYTANLWAFNRGTRIIEESECWSVEEAKEMCRVWWHNFVSGLVNCH